jgi:hypothetical protein
VAMRLPTVTGAEAYRKFDADEIRREAFDGDARYALSMSLAAFRKYLKAAAVQQRRMSTRAARRSRAVSAGAVALAVAAALTVGACRDPGVINLVPRLACTLKGGPSGSGGCDEISLACASLVEVRVFEALGDGGLGEELSPRTCVDITDADRLATLCDLAARRPARVVSGRLPQGHRARVALRLLRAHIGGARCTDDDVVPIVKGLSEAFELDGDGHDVELTIDLCPGCFDGPTSCQGDGGPCPHLPPCDALPEQPLLEAGAASTCE